MLRLIAEQIATGHHTTGVVDYEGFQRFPTRSFSECLRVLSDQATSIHG